MLLILRLFACFCCLTFFSISSHAEENQPQLAAYITSPAADPVTVDLVHQEESILPGKPIWIGVHLKIDKGWHAYWKNPGDAGMAPVIAWQLPPGFQIGSVLWPTPHHFILGSSHSFGYETEVTLLAELIPPSSYSEEPVSIGTNLRWVVCSDATCLPGESEASLSLPVSRQPPKIDAQAAETLRKAWALLPEKADLMKASRKQNLIEIALDYSDADVQKADFFPEDKGSVDYTIPTLLQKSDQPSQYTILVKEASPTSALKGVLVLETSQGNKAYDLNVPILDDAEDRMISMSAPHKNAEISNGDSDFQGGISFALLLAFAGGLLLNLMPCVLPVISLKILSFVKMAGQSRTLIFQHGLAFSIGVLLSFWLLAGLLLMLQAYGSSVGWGFQLQEPLFVAALAALLFVFGLSLFGLFEMGTSLISAAGQIQPKTEKSHQLLGSFLSGILATVVATPCTGPFLGTAVGFAVTLPAFQALLIFTSLGLGMCFPYLALAAFPVLLRFVPKPGAWMQVFKELMGFLMMATVIWLMWVFSAQTNSLAVILLLASFFFLGTAAWIYGRWGTPIHKKLTRIVAIATALVFFASGSYTIVTASSSWIDTLGSVSSIPQNGAQEVGAADAWEQFSPERVVALRKKGVPVFIDFTAKWCLICQANHMILSAEELSQQFTKLGVVKMKADWTKSDRVITEELRKFGRNSVPLYVLYGADGEEAKILPQVLTADIVSAALKELEAE